MTVPMYQLQGHALLSFCCPSLSKEISCVRVVISLLYSWTKYKKKINYTSSDSKLVNWSNLNVTVGCWDRVAWFFFRPSKTFSYTITTSRAFPTERRKHCSAGKARQFELLSELCRKGPTILEVFPSSVGEVREVPIDTFYSIFFFYLNSILFSVIY